MTPAFVAAEGGRGGRAIRGEGEAQLAYSPAGQSRSGGGNDVMSLHMPVDPMLLSHAHTYADRCYLVTHCL